MTEPKRLAIARLSHEGNSFTPVPTGLAEFRRREWASGEAARALYRGSASELGAAVDFLEAHPEWQGTFLRCCAAPPGGPVEAWVLNGIRAEILEGLAGGDWDAVYISLHGALLGIDEPTPELDLRTAVHAAIGDVPLAVSFDLHANLDPAIAHRADIVLGYKTYPHVDTYETGAKALALLARTVAGEIAPVSRILPLGTVLPSFNMRTANGPMAEIEARARELAQLPRILDVTPFGGFAYADVAQAGASVSVCADGDAPGAEAAAEAAVRELLNCFEARKAEFALRLPSAAEALDRALKQSGRPVAVLEPADNPMSGGIGDTTGLFRALLESQPGMPTAFAFFWDPELVERARAAGIGAELQCRFGARLSTDYGAPIEAKAKVVRLTEGRFVNRGPMERGLTTDLGPTTVLEVAGIRVIVTSSCQSPNDTAYFDLHGVDLTTLGLLCAKAKNHFRAAFAPHFAALIDADTPGPAALDLHTLPYRHVPPARLLSAPRRTV